MVKKLQKMAQDKKNNPAAGLLDSQLAQSVKDSAQQIWLAGMGAFAKAQEEGGKVFEALVKEGSSLQRKTQAVAEERISEVTNRVSAVAEGVSSKAGQQWDKLESIFEERVAKAMNKLGVPARKDVDALIGRIDALSAQVAKLSPAGKPSARKSATKAVNGAAAPARKRASAARKSA